MALNEEFKYRYERTTDHKSAMPSNQAHELMPRSFTHMQTLRSVKIVGYTLVMLRFDLPFNIAKLKSAPISRIIINSNKPRRNSFFTLLIRASHDWPEQKTSSTQ